MNIGSDGLGIPIPLGREGSVTITAGVVAVGIFQSTINNYLFSFSAAGISRNSVHYIVGNINLKHPSCIQCRNIRIENRVLR
jgi:hypothetical protein